MRILWIVLLLTTNLLGCVKVQEGNFIKTPKKINQELAEDIAKQLVSIYPPARTNFYMNTRFADNAFRASFINTLRQKGYGLNESSIPGVHLKAGNAYTLYYLLDETIKKRLYRVSIVVGKSSFSRAYKIKKDTLIPLGLWSFRE